MSDDESPAFVADEWWQTHHGNGIPEDDSNGVCVISYSPEYVTGMNLFRSVVAKKDVSPQVLPLLSHLISLNPGNYSVWHYRRILLAALVTSHDPLVYQKELQYVSDMAEEHPKNYQIWYHRQAVVSLLFSGGDAAKAQEDLDFVAKVFEEDAKNYHAWTYRQWVIARSNLWEQELAFTDELIAKDVRNNSAWTQRHFVFTKGPKTFADPAILASEISYTTSKIQRSPNNESAWNYLRGIVKEKYKDHPSIKAFCVELRGKGVINPHLFSTQADIAIEEGNKQEASELFDLLQKNVDTIHKKYWEYRRAQLAL